MGRLKTSLFELQLSRPRPEIPAADMSSTDNRKLKQLRRRPQRRLQNNNGLNDENNSSARASRF